MQDTSVEQIYINFSQRSVKIVDDEGAYKTVNWKWDEEGSEGFAETVTQIAENVDSDLVTIHFCIEMIGPIGITEKQAEEYLEFLVDLTDSQRVCLEDHSTRWNFCYDGSCQ